MSDSNQETPWEGRRTQASYDFALRCRELRDSDPYGKTERREPILVQIMSDLVTELWDQGFSQTELNEALKIATDCLRKYSAGKDRRT